MSETIDARCTLDIVCPYCAEIFDDSWECGDEGPIECPNPLCGMKFDFYSEHTTHYWSQRNCRLNCKEHEWEIKFELYEGTAEVCRNCDQIRFVRREPDARGDVFAANAEGQSARG